MLRKIVSGGDNRKSRLHTEQNDLIDMRQAIWDLPFASIGKIYTLLAGKRLRAPWWPTRVIPLIEKRINKKSVVFEYGCGSSTLWLAERACQVYAVEDSEVWADKVEKQCQLLKADNVHLLLRNSENYWSIPNQISEIDLAIIDGKYRWKCLESVFPRIAPGGTIYLDNADSDKDRKYYEHPDHTRLVQGAMESIAANHPGANLTKIRSLVNGELYAGEGWLLDIPFDRPSKTL